MTKFYLKIIILALLTLAFKTNLAQSQKPNFDDPNFLLKSTTAQQNSAKTNACATSDNHATPYNSNNGQRGCMFDVTATNSVTVQCFDANLYAGTTADYEIYYKVGTHVGSENNSAAWTLIGSAAGVSSAGTDVPTAIPIPVGVTIPAGQTYAFYITNTSGGGTSYTDGAAVGNLLSSDANISVYEGVGKSYPFGLTFTVRNFNGTIYYDLAVPLSVEFIELTAKELENKSVNLDWETKNEQNLKGFAVQVSTDAENFENIDWVDAKLTENNTYSVNYTPLDPQEIHYFRVKSIDLDGEENFSEIVEFEYNSQDIEIYPNPVSNTLFISKSIENATVKIQNLLGKIIVEQKISGSEIDISKLNAGFYFITIENRDNNKKILTQKILVK